MAIIMGRLIYLGGMAVWGAACAFAATLLRNFASYSAALSGITVAIIAGDLVADCSQGQVAECRVIEVLADHSHSNCLHGDGHRGPTP